MPPVYSFTDSVIQSISDVEGDSLLCHWKDQPIMTWHGLTTPRVPDDQCDHAPPCPRCPRCPLAPARPLTTGHIVLLSPAPLHLSTLGWQHQHQPGSRLVKNRFQVTRCPPVTGAGQTLTWLDHLQLWIVWRKDWDGTKTPALDIFNSNLIHVYYPLLWPRVQLAVVSHSTLMSFVWMLELGFLNINSRWPSLVIGM